MYPKLSKVIGDLEVVTKKADKEDELLGKDFVYTLTDDMEEVISLLKNFRILEDRYEFSKEKVEALKKELDE